MKLPAIDGWKQANEEDISEIQECFCPNCQQGNGTTLLLPTNVPGFREIIIATLTCPDCNFKNSEVSFGGEIQPRGKRITLNVKSSDDLNRLVLKSDSTTIFLPSLDLEVPSRTQKGTLTTLEGFLSRISENLSAQQPERLKVGDIENFRRCQSVIDRVERMTFGVANGDSDHYDDEDAESVYPFHFIIDDPAGNAFIESPHAPNPDPDLKVESYERTPSQDMSLGLQPSKAAVQEGRIDDSNPRHKNIANTVATHAVSFDQNVNSIGRQEVMSFATACSNCHQPAETSMCVTDIPHFKEVIIMSMNCSHCGFKSNEIKAGGAIPEYGCRITLRIRSLEDLSREVLKSDTAGIQIPEIGLELQEGGLDGLYTTVEGLIIKMRDGLQNANPFGSGDYAMQQHISNNGGEFSEPSSATVRFLEFLKKLGDLSEGKILPFTLIIFDPLANSFIGPVAKDAISLSLQAERDGNTSCFETYIDDGMDLEEFERSHDQDEILGLNDIKTERYNPEVQDYGTDKLAKVPDRISRVDVRGADHPHDVCKAPVENDTTVMGERSARFCVPSITKRGRMLVPPPVSSCE